MPDPTNPFSAFAPKPTPVTPSEGFSLFAPQPLTRSQGRGAFERVGTFQGGSQYDDGLVFGQDQYQKERHVYSDK